MKNYKHRTGIISIFVISAICIFLRPADNQAGAVQSLTSEFLVAGTWGPETGSWGSPDDVGMKLKFKADGHFESETMYGQDGCSADGTYSIKSEKLSLSMENTKTEPFCGIMTLKNGIIGTDPSSPKYRRYILFKKEEVKGLYFEEDLKIWDYNSIVEEGELLSIGGLKATAMGVKKARTTNAVKVRETPGIKGKEIHYSYEDYDSGESVTLKAIPENNIVTVLARTTEKDKVGKWNNYWYYVEYRSNSCGWVYGKFIKIK